MGLFGKANDGKNYNVAFGSGGSAVQAHKAAIARREKAAATRQANREKAAKARGKK